MRRKILDLFRHGEKQNNPDGRAGQGTERPVAATALQEGIPRQRSLPGEASYWSGFIASI
jgi:hypothetical protein